VTINQRLLAVTFAAVLAGIVLLGSSCKLANKTPSVPTLSGPTTGVAGVALTFTATATDPEADSVAFQFDWGDGATPAWTAFVASGDTVTATNTYTDSGTFTVKARAKDSNGKESDWSAGYSLSLIAAGPAHLDTIIGSIAFPWGVFAADMSRDGSLLGLGGVTDRDTIVVIRTADRAQLMRMGVDRRPAALAFSPDNRYIYASGETNDTATISKVDIVQARVVTSVPVAEVSYELAVTPDGSRVLVGIGTQVKVLGADSLNVIDSVSLPYHVSYLTLNEAGTALYVSTDHGIGIVDLPSCSLRVFSAAVDPARTQVLSHDEQTLYASSHADSGLAVLSADDLSMVRRINIHRDGVGDMQTSPDGGYVYVSWGGILVMDTRTSTVVDSLDLPSHGIPLMHPNGDSLYYVGGSAVYVIGRR
jgi:DNA-binding beta-propeller fold protein YncE